MLTATLEEVVGALLSTMVGVGMGLVAMHAWRSSRLALK